MVLALGLRKCNVIFNISVTYQEKFIDSPILYVSYKFSKQSPIETKCPFVLKIVNITF